ncbi:MAG: glucosamine-6-phosphate deaminase [bacterium]
MSATRNEKDLVQQDQEESGDPEMSANEAAQPTNVCKVTGDPTSPNRSLSSVERIALEQSGYELMYPPQEKIPSIIVPNFPALGRLVAVRFLEWVLDYPEGVVSLPTGKTPEHFIKDVQLFLIHWDRKEVRQQLEDMGLNTSRRPELSGLRFVQIDEFYPIDTKQHNSFFYYVNKFYIRGFGIDPANALFINPNKIGIPAGKKLTDIFPNMTVDLSLRVRRAKSLLEKQQQETLYAADRFCVEYETKIRGMGGIGFFLGGIGPDGHIAFNVRGSDIYSTTRLCEANYETKAAAATDLGGIEVSRDKHVITIGLSTIVHNPNVVALIIAAGEAKARVVADSIQSDVSIKYPASILATAPNGRFYITHGTAKRLTNRSFVDFSHKACAEDEDIHRIVMNLSLQTKKPIRALTLEDYQNDRCGAEILRKKGRPHDELNEMTERRVLENLRVGNSLVENTTILHTAPHHDDIILAYLPYFTNLARRSNTKHYFAYMTSGFTAVTNRYMQMVVDDLLARLGRGEFDNLLREDYFYPSNKAARRLDTALFLQGASRHREEQKQAAVARRLLRNMIELYEDDNIQNLIQRLRELQNYFQTQYPGKKDIPLVQVLKGRMREFESDLKWAYYGFTGDSVRHMRLGFYKGDIFTEVPTLDRDIQPIVKLLIEINPGIVTVAFDPEGSGPDTHYKVLQAVSEALKIYENQTGRHDVRVLGYRNVWYRFHPSEANMYVPASLRHLSDMEACFDTCFTTQRTASFPSYELDGPFSWLARKIQVQQFEQVKTFLGEDFFVYSDDHTLRACCAIVYLREMSLEEFYTKSDELRSLSEDQ